MASQNVSFASPLADAKYAQILGSPQISGFLTKLSEVSGWTVAFTIFLVLVAYDQCKYLSHEKHSHWYVHWYVVAADRS